MTKGTDAAYAEMAAYDEYVESQRQELRLEGAEELRKEILRLLTTAKKFSTLEMDIAYSKAISLVEGAFI